jgi:hypothetical protein
MDRPGANPTTGICNASAVKSYNAAYYLERFLLIKITLSHYNASIDVVNSDFEGLAPVTGIITRRFPASGGYLLTSITSLYFSTSNPLQSF